MDLYPPFATLLLLCNFLLDQKVPGATPEVRDGMRFVEVVLSLCSNIHMQKIWPRIEASQESVVYCYDLDVDPLDVHADKNTFHRFDKFNLMYSPCGQISPREIFLKQDNLIQVASWLNTEYPYIGESKLSGTNFASWIVNNELYSDNVVWLIQLPRLYNIYKEMGIVTSFQTILDFTIHTRLQLTCEVGHIDLDYGMKAAKKRR
ncbi:AMP deaminase-like protein [Tanacetum coccineum]